MSDTPAAPPSPPQSAPSRRFASTALLVHSVSALTSGALLVVAYFQKDLSAREVFGSFGLSVACVGLFWSVALALRARGESSVIPVLIPWLTAWEFSIPLLLLWHNPLQDFGPAWYYLAYSGIPLILPLLTLSATVAIGAFLILKRFFRRSESNPTVTRKKTVVGALAIGLLVFASLLPFGFVLYAATMSSKWTSAERPFWPASLLEAVPHIVSDNAYRLANALPKKIGGRIADDVANKGLLSVEEYRHRLNEMDPAKNYDALSTGYAIRYPEDILHLAKERLDQPAERTVLSNVLAYQFARKASTAELKEILVKRRTRQGGFTTLGDSVLRYIFGRTDMKELAEDIAALEDAHPDITLWKLRELARNGNDEQTKDAYIRLLQSKAPQTTVNTANDYLMRRRRWPPIFAALEHTSKDVRKNSRIGLSWHALGRPFLDNFTMHLIEHRPAYMRMLNSADRDDATAIAVIIHALAGVNRQAMITNYGNPGPRSDLNWTKIQAVNAQEKQSLIDEARTILHSGNAR